jgi:hypothetical protein
MMRVNSSPWKSCPEYSAPRPRAMAIARSSRLPWLCIYAQPRAHRAIRVFRQNVRHAPVVPQNLSWGATLSRLRLGRSRNSWTARRNSTRQYDYNTLRTLHPISNLAALIGSGSAGRRKPSHPVVGTAPHSGRRCPASAPSSENPPTRWFQSPL